MRRYGESREQIYQSCIDDLIAQNNPVRMLDLLIDHLIIESEIRDPKGHSKVGRRSYSGTNLIKLWIYGILNGINTCRGLEQLAQVNIEVIWLLRQERPCYKTIANFRKDNGVLIMSLFYGLIRLLHEDRYVDGELWVLDGHKCKANAKRDMHSVAKLRKQIDELEDKLEVLLNGLSTPEEVVESESDHNDDDDMPKADSANGTEAGNSDEVSRLDMIEECQANLIDKKGLLDSAIKAGQNYISKTDPDSVLLSTRRGKCAGYNLQGVVDGAHHFIVALDATREATDNRSLYQSIHSTADRTGITPKTVLADRGYTNFSDIFKLVTEYGNGIYVTLQKSSRENQDIIFVYDKDKDELTCSQGRRLVRCGSTTQKGVLYHTYRCTDCSGCPLFGECTTSPKGRIYRLAENHEFIESYRARMEEIHSRQILKKRKSIVEHIFGTLGHMMRYNGFRLRGLVKVSIEAYLYALCYNIKRLIHLITGQDKKGIAGILRQKLCNLLFFITFLWGRAFFSQFSRTCARFSLKRAF